MLRRKKLYLMTLVLPLSVLFATMPAIKGYASKEMPIEDATAPVGSQWMFGTRMDLDRSAALMPTIDSAAPGMASPSFIADLPNISNDAIPATTQPNASADTTGEANEVPATAQSEADDRQALIQLATIDDTTERKQAFVELLTPAIEETNAKILSDREHLERIADAYNGGEEIPTDDLVWLQGLAAAYKSDSSDLAELLLRVDVVPSSLAISQAAIESGWGSSKLAKNNLALFGQTDGGNGYPAFGSLKEGVEAYINNLNTHKAYAGLREARAAARLSGDGPDGYKLAAYLTRYSELGKTYVRKVQSVMKSKDLHLIEQAEK